ncbi:MAG: amino acid--tRNA ligase-related protein [Candidatus Bathyarchaeia archaeon]|jgi:asparaginyl-tRNA synthetase
MLKSSLKQTNERYKLFGLKELRTVAKVEATLLRSAREWLDRNGFMEVIVPHVVNATGSCEIVDTLFRVPYFGKDAYLTQTGQLYLEALVPFLGGKVWTFGSSFRAEPRADDRHLTEFSLLELEFEGDFNALLNTIEDMFSSMMAAVQELPEVMNWMNLKHPFKRMRYEDAIAELGLTFGMDTTSADEKKLLENNDDQPMFITHFPKDLKYFNMRQNDADSRIVNSADFLLPFGGESAGAAEREFNPNKLRQRLVESGMWTQFIGDGGDKHAFDWYLDAYQKYDYKLHSGFGMGINRVTKYVLQLDDIRATTVYPTNAETIY